MKNISIANFWKTFAIQTLRKLLLQIQALEKAFAW